MARTTLQDVAREAGVSVATVDRVLNGRAGIHARMIDRVKAAVERLPQADQEAITKYYADLLGQAIEDALVCEKSGGC